MRWSQEHFTGVDWDHKTRSNGVFRLAGPATKTTGSVGFRLDAIKHIDRKFLLNWRSGDKKMFCVSEYWSGNLKLIMPYIRAFKGETAFFDVPLHMKLYEASRHRSRYDIRTIFNDTVVGVKPGDAVTFVDNHDTVEGQTLESWVESGFKIQAYALILLRGGGYPCVFYGDLYPNKECYNENVARNIELLVEARRMFAYGASEDFISGDRNCIGFVRKGDETHTGCAVILSNRDEGSYMTQHGRIEIDSTGWGTFSCFPSSVQVW
ncbi:glycoside hydrolase superfamily, partial [Cyathus striatus]